MTNFEISSRIWDYLKFLFEEVNESQNECYVEITAKHSAILTEKDGKTSSEILPIVELEWNMTDISEVAKLAQKDGVAVYHITSEDAADVMIDREEKFVFTNVSK